MKKCALCNNQYSDGVKCNTCDRDLDFGCANLSEAGWRKLGASRRAQWTCPKCKVPPPAASTPEPPATLDSILSEIQAIKRQLQDLPTLIKDMQVLRTDLAELKDAYGQHKAILDNFDTRLNNLEIKSTQFDKLHATTSTIQEDLAKMKLDLFKNEQRTRANNIEIKGVPGKKEENLFKIIETIGQKIKYNCPKSQINYISRVPMYNSKEKLIIVSFLNRYVKEDFIAAARATKDLAAIQGSGRVYINDHLCTYYKNLLTLTKTMAKEKKYEYVWVKHGKIHVRKNNTSKSFYIWQESDLNKLI